MSLPAVERLEECMASTQTLLAGLDELARKTKADFAAVSWTPIGVATYGRFMEMRAFDFWGIDPSEPLADGRVELRGDIALARRLATSLRFTR